MHFIVYIQWNGMHLWWLDIFICGLGWSMRHGGSNALSFGVLDHDHCLSLCHSILTWDNKHQNEMVSLWHCCDSYCESFIGQSWTSLVSLFLECSGLRSIDELSVHSHHFFNELIWLNFGRTSDQQHHYLQRTWRRSIDNGRGTIDET